MSISRLERQIGELMKLREKLWIWGQDAGSHHAVGNNVWKLPGVNRLGPVEGCAYLGIPNCCRVIMNGLPEPPFDAEADRLNGMRSVVWSIIGDGGSIRNNESTDLEEVIRIAKTHSNISGAIMDDFMNEKRMKLFPPERLAAMRERLHAALEDRKLDLWSVLYCHELSEKAVPWLRQIDRISLWAWCAEELRYLEKNHARLRELMADDPKPVLAGCYLFDYGGCRPMPMDLMKLQLDVYYRWLRAGTIDGVIFCSNTVADIGLAAADYAREWISVHGDEELPEKR